MNRDLVKTIEEVSKIRFVKYPVFNIVKDNLEMRNKLDRFQSDLGLFFKKAASETEPVAKDITFEQAKNVINPYILPDYSIEENLSVFAMTVLMSNEIIKSTSGNSNALILGTQAKNAAEVLIQQKAPNIKGANEDSVLEMIENMNNAEHSK